jgi:probable HAF family extracellular repeat protein
MQRLTVLIAAVVCCFAPSHAYTARYQVQDLGVLPGDATNDVLDLNDAGQAVGVSYKASGWDHGYIWQDGVLQQIGTLAGYDYGRPDSISNNGRIVGQARTTAGDNTRACMWYQGQITNLGTLGGESWAKGVNDLGQITGTAINSYGYAQAFLWENGVMRAIGQYETWGMHINNRSEIVGWYINGVGRHRGFVWHDGVARSLATWSNASTEDDGFNGINDPGQVIGYSHYRAAIWQPDGTMTAVGTLGGTISTASGINNKGQVTGMSTTSTGAQRGYIWENGVMTDLNTLIPANSGWTIRAAGAINESGQIIAMGLSDKLHSVILTPVPEPASILGVLAGIVGIAAMAGSRTVRRNSMS